MMRSASGAAFVAAGCLALGCGETAGPAVLPSAMIVHPTPSDTIYAGSAIAFVARLEPPDAIAEYEWESSLDGVLGGGDSLTAILTTPGRHVISVSAAVGGREVDVERIAIDARANNAPILHFPRGETRFFADSVRLTVRFEDVEDGSQPVGGFAWESDLDGPLEGTDRFAGNLSVGSHLISVSAEDAGGVVVTDTLRITTLPPPTGTAWEAAGFDASGVGSNSEVFVDRGANVVAINYSEIPAHSSLYDPSGLVRANLAGGRLRSLSADGTALVVDTALRRVSPSGTPIWQTARLTSGGTAEGAEIAEAADGSVVVLASAASATGYVVYADGHADCVDSLSVSAAAKYTALGSLLWRAELPNACQRPLLGIGADGTVYTTVFAHDSLIHVTALDGETGAERWSAVLHARLVLQPMAVAPDGTVLLRDNLGTLVALSAADGSVRWTLSGVYSGAAVDGSGSVYVLGRPATNVFEIRAHALSSGALLWSAVLDTVSQYMSNNFTVAADGTVYWAASHKVIRVSGPAHSVTVMYEDPRPVGWGPFFDDAGNVVELFYDGRMIAWSSAGPAPGWPSPRGDFRGTRRVQP